VGGVVSFNAKRLTKRLAGAKDCDVVLTVDRLHATRSRRANAYYWGVIIAALSQYTGYHPLEAHEAMKALHLPKALTFVDGNGEVRGEVVLGGSTRLMNVNEFYDYVERVRQWAAEQLGVVTPDPHGDDLDDRRPVSRRDREATA